MQTEFQSTQDQEAIREVACHPDVWPILGGDWNAETWQPRIGEGVHWFVQDGVLLMFHRHRLPSWEVHIGSLPEARGKSAQVAQNAFAWMRANTECEFVLGYIRKPNERCLKLAYRVGMDTLFTAGDFIVVGRHI